MSENEKKEDKTKLEDPKNKRLLEEMFKLFERKLIHHEKNDDDFQKVERLISAANKNNSKRYWSFFSAIMVVLFLGVGGVFWMYYYMSANPSPNDIKISRLMDATENQTLLYNIEDELKRAITAHRKIYIIKARNNNKPLSRYWREWTPKMITGVAKNLASAIKYKGMTPEALVALWAAENKMKYWNNSGAGARGLGQLMPETADEEAHGKWWLQGELNLHDPIVNSELSIGHTSWLYYKGKKYFGKKFHFTDMVHCYNAGYRSLSKWKRTGAYGRKSFKDPQTDELRKRAHFYYTNYNLDNWSAAWKEEYYKAYPDGWDKDIWKTK